MVIQIQYSMNSFSFKFNHEGYLYSDTNVKPDILRILFPNIFLSIFILAERVHTVAGPRQ